LFTGRLLIGHLVFLLFTEGSCRSHFAGLAKQSRYVASSGAHSTKYKEPKHQVLCLAG